MTSTASSYSNLSAATVVNSDRFPQQGGVPILRLLLTVQLEDPQMAHLVLRPDPLQFRAPFTYSTVSDQWRTRVNSEIKKLCFTSDLVSWWFGGEGVQNLGTRVPCLFFFQ